MQLKTFNALNIEQKRTSSAAAKIGVSSKSGSIRFNGPAVERMGLKKNDLVQFHNDSESPSDWYLEIVPKDGFLLRVKQNVTGKDGLLCQSTGIVKEIFASVKFDGVTANIFIAPESVTHEKRILWPLSLRDLLTK